MRFIISLLIIIICSFRSFFRFGTCAKEILIHVYTPHVGHVERGGMSEILVSDALSGSQFRTIGRGLK